MSQVLLAAEVSFRRLHGSVAKQELNLLDFAAAGVAHFAQVRRRSCGAICSIPAFSQHPFTTYQTTFCEIPSPQSLSVRATARKILPSLPPAAFVHSSSAALTHNGMGTVRMCP